MSNPIKPGSTHAFKVRGSGGRVCSVHTVEVTDVRPVGRGHQVTYKSDKNTLKLSLSKFEKAVA